MLKSIQKGLRPNCGFPKRWYLSLLAGEGQEIVCQTMEIRVGGKDHSWKREAHMQWLGGESAQRRMRGILEAPQVQSTDPRGAVQEGEQGAPP